MNTAKQTGEKARFQVTYFKGKQGYEVAIDAQCGITEAIARTTVNASTRAEALQLALQNFVEAGHMNKAQAELYASEIKPGAKSARRPS